MGAGILRVSIVEAGILRVLCRTPEGCGYPEAMRDACFYTILKSYSMFEAAIELLSVYFGEHESQTG